MNKHNLMFLAAFKDLADTRVKTLEEKVSNYEETSNKKENIQGKSGKKTKNDGDNSNDPLIGHKKKRNEGDSTKSEKSEQMQIDEITSKASSTSTIDISKTREVAFDIANLSKTVSVSGNKVTLTTGSKSSEHKFVFVNAGPNENEWKFTVHNFTNWVGVGLCQKEFAIQNKFKFLSKENNFSHGFFGVSINGFVWNCAAIEENNKPSQDFPKTFQKNDSITIKYAKDSNELTYIAGKFKGKLTNVHSSKGTLVPCIILLHAGDEVSVECI